MPDPDSNPDTSARHTLMPGPISPRVETPPGVEAAATPRSSPPIALTDPRVAIVDLQTRRLLRGLCALLIAGLTVYGDATGHPVSGVTVAVLGLLGVGTTSAVEAARKRPGATAAGGAALLLVSLLGDLVDVRELGSMAAFGVGGAVALVDRARGA
jgi:hypothetical protein